MTDPIDSEPEQVTVEEWILRLDKIGAAIHSTMQTLRVPVHNDDDKDLSRTTKSLLLFLVTQAAAIREIIRTENASAAYPNLRSLFEATVELEYLLRHGNKFINARKMMIYALREWRSLLAEIASDEQEAAELVRVNVQLDEYRQRDPVAMKAIDDLRWGHHWSGQSRTNLIKTVDSRIGPDPGWMAQFYRTLSWEAHATTACLLNVREIEVDGELVHRHAHSMTPAENRANVAEYTARILIYAWNLFCDAFGLDLWEGSQI